VDVSARNVLHLYFLRLRARAPQELLALLGIAAGVALLFASLVASNSLSGSIADLNAGVVGRATLQLSSRGPQGFPASVLARVRAIPGVRLAAPLLELNGQLIGTRRSAAVQVIGADQTLGSLEGKLVRRVSLTPFPGLGALVLPAPLARTIGANTQGPEMRLDLAGRRSTVALFATLSASEFGSLAQAPIAVAPLEYVQQLSGLHARLTRILIEPAAGAERAVRARLQAIASAPTAPDLHAGILNVQPSDWEVRLFAKAATATNQSTDLFALLSALVGFLFAFNAVLLTAPQRRRLIADLRREGYDPRVVLAVLLGDALGLAIAACVVGLLLGDQLSIHLFSATPGYLSSAFALGAERVVGWKPPVLAAAGGVTASLVAVLSPMREIFSADPLAATAAPARASLRHTSWGAALGLGALGASVAILLAAPAQAVWGILALVLALVALLPVALAAVLWLLRQLAPLLRAVAPHIAIMELRSGRSRAVAITATCGIAVLGASSLQAARGDLLAGLDNAARDVNRVAQVWVAPPGSSSLLLTQPFADSRRQASGPIAALAGVRLSPYLGALLDVGERRVWVLAPSPQEHPLLPPSQLIEGNLTTANRHVAEGGWAMISLALGEERHLAIGQRFTLPSPYPLPLRVAAIGTNIGWAPGAIVMSARDFVRGWGSADASALAVHIAAPAAEPQTVRRINGILSATGLQAVTARSRELRQRTLTRQGLARLSQIATLMLIAAALAVAAVIGAMIWQRRPRLAKLKLEGFSPALLWRTIVLETVLLVSVGSLAGGVLALLGQRLLDQALRHVINYPVEISIGVVPVLESIALVTAAAVVIVALPGAFAVRVPASAAMEE
jgi:putative ABC transport system permease protein